MNAGIYEQLAALSYLPAAQRLIEGAIELDVFSHLTTPCRASFLAQEMGWHGENTLHLLQALTSLGYVHSQEDTFVNTPQASKYLVKSSPFYMGDVVLFFCSSNRNALANLVEQVKKGPLPMPENQKGVDFAAFGPMMRKAQSGIRQQEILDLVRALPENDNLHSILDLGCGAGLLGLALARDQAGRRVVLFDQPAMKPLLEESIALQQMEECAVAMEGDFLRDEIGEGYDLILCSSILSFALPEGPAFFAKLKKALNPGGVVLCLNEGIEEDYSGPWDMVVGYLEYHLQGLSWGVKKGQVSAAAREGGFSSIEEHTQLLSTGTYEIHLLRS